MVFGSQSSKYCDFAVEIAIAGTGYLLEFDKGVHAATHQGGEDGEPHALMHHSVEFGYSFAHNAVLSVSNVAHKPERKQLPINRSAAIETVLPAITANVVFSLIALLSPGKNCYLPTPRFCVELINKTSTQSQGCSSLSWPPGVQKLNILSLADGLAGLSSPVLGSYH